MEGKVGEVWVGESRLYLDERNILHEILVGDIDAETVLAFYEADLRIRSGVEGEVNVLVDLTRTGKPSAEARKIAQERLESEGIGKVALFGLHPVARVIASFIMGITRKSDMRFFTGREEALDWLKGESSALGGE